MQRTAIVTAVNDHMIGFFRLWAHAVSRLDTGLPVFVVPFSHDCEHVARICARHGFTLLDRVPENWMEIGRRIYGAEEYRNDVPAARYFAKLGVFDVPAEVIVYFDANALPFEPPEHVVPAFLESGADILLEWQVFGIGRNIANEAVAERLNALNPDIGIGWGMQSFIARTSAFSISRAERICGRANLREEFGSAPEQSFLTRYLAEHRIPVGQTRRHYRASVGASCRSTIECRDGGLSVEIKKRQRRVRFVKWNGPTVDPDLPNYWILALLLEKVDG